MVMHVMSYDILVRGVVLYPLGVTIDFWEEISYYCLDGISHKVSFSMKFIGGQVGKSNKSTMVGGFSSFPHGFELSRRVTSMIKMNPQMGNW